VRWLPWWAVQWYIGRNFLFDVQRWHILECCVIVVRGLPGGQVPGRGGRKRVRRVPGRQICGRDRDYFVLDVRRRHILECCVIVVRGLPGRQVPGCSERKCV
jgi:hypothetical protein